MHIIHKEIDLLHKHIELLTGQVKLLEEKVKIEAVQAPNAPIVHFHESDTEDTFLNIEESLLDTAPVAGPVTLPNTTPAIALDISETKDTAEQLVLEGIEKPVCKVDGCDDEILAKGFCSHHYYRNKRYGGPLNSPPKRRKVRKKAKTKFCSYEECRAQLHAKGLCSYHYNRMKRYGHPSGDPDRAVSINSSEHSESVTLPEPAMLSASTEEMKNYHREAELIINGIREGV